MPFPISLIVEQGRPRRRIEIGDEIVLDALVRERHERQSTVTTHPIETGGRVTDHIYREPDRLEIEGVVSNTPFGLFRPFQGGISERRIEAWNQLADLLSERAVFTVVSGLEVYEEMVVTHLEAPRERRTGEALYFRIELQRLEFVAAEVVPLPADLLRSSERDLAQPKLDAGRQETEEASDAVRGRGSSLLFDIMTDVLPGLGRSKRRVRGSGSF